jgi:hypothetical protein
MRHQPLILSVVEHEVLAAYARTSSMSYFFFVDRLGLVIQFPYIPDRDTLGIYRRRKDF